MQEFNFDYWKNLAETSPADFEAQRRKALQEVIDDAPPAKQSALTALVDTLCAPQQGTPLERAINAQVLMIESLTYLRTGWTELAAATEEGSPLEQALLNAQIAINSVNAPTPSYLQAPRPAP